VNRIGLTRTPTLLLHGLQDEKIPKENSDRLLSRALMTSNFEAFSFDKCDSAVHSRDVSPIELKLFPGARHNSVFQANGWVESVQAFADCVEGSRV